MTSKEDITTVPVQKETHREIKEAKFEGETWSRFLKRAVDSLDSDKAFTEGQEERLNELISESVRDEFEEECEELVDEALDDLLVQ
ncbi:hypothetical protein ACM16X_01780 [Haloarcula japonica]|uniref:hypothetical protein n=1 Tax=Haloarcula japonica TaxID=29282 RepID=UPI0039F68B60